MSFLDSVGSEWIEEDGAEPEPEVQSEPEEGQVEEFAPDLEPEPEQNPEPIVSEPPKAPAMVPYAEMRKYRERAQEAERELAEARRVVQPPPQAPKVPDAYEQPEEFNRYIADQRDNDKFEIRAEISGFRAEQTYGKETVEAATQWALAQNDPALGQKVRASASPVELVVQEYQRSRTLETLGDKSLDDWFTARAIEKGWIVSPEPEASQPKPSTPTPPRSLASRPGSGGLGHTAQGDDFGGIFSSTGMGLKK